MTVKWFSSVINQLLYIFSIMSISTRWRPLPVHTFRFINHQMIYTHLSLYFSQLNTTDPVGLLQPRSRVYIAWGKHSWNLLWWMDFEYLFQGYGCIFFAKLPSWLEGMSQQEMFENKYLMLPMFSFSIKGALPTRAYPLFSSKKLCSGTYQWYITLG